MAQTQGVPRVPTDKIVPEGGWNLRRYADSLEEVDQNETWSRTVSSLKKTVEMSLRKLQYVKSVKWLIFPDDVLYGYWSFIIGMLLLYTATVTPYKIWFMKNQHNAFFMIDIIVDCLFFADIIFTCFLAYFDDNNNIVTDRHQIIWNYLRGWMLLDIVATLPIVYLAGGADNYNNLGRMVRLPRLIKLFRLTKFSRLHNIRTHNKALQKKVNKYCKYLTIDPGLERLILFICTFLIIIHLVACFWGLLGQEGPEPVENWIFQNNFVDETPWDLFEIWFYWAITTLTTVGYGDISPQNYMERWYADFVMIGGIFVYSYIIGAVANVISGLNTGQEQRQHQYDILNKIAKKYNISPLFYRKIQNAIDYERKQRNKDFEQFLQDMPSRIKNELLTVMYEKMLEKNAFFQDKSVAFVGYIVPKLQFIRFDEGDFIYKTKEPAQEMLFVVKGEIGLCVRSLIGQVKVYKTIEEGQHFGEIDMLVNPKRIHKDDARAMTFCELLTLQNEDLLDVFNKFEIVADSFMEKVNEDAVEFEILKRKTKQALNGRRATRFETVITSPKNSRRSGRSVSQENKEMPPIDDENPAPHHHLTTPVIPGSARSAARETTEVRQQIKHLKEDIQDMRYEHNQLKKIIKEIHYHTVVANDDQQSRDKNHSPKPFLAATSNKYNSVRNLYTSQIKEQEDEDSDRVMRRKQKPTRAASSQPFKRVSARGKQKYEAVELSERFSEGPDEIS